MYLHRVMKMQSANGHDVHILSTRAEENMPSADAGYFVHRFDFAHHDGFREDMRKAKAFIWNTEAKRATERIIHDVKPDVIHLHNIYHHLSTSILDPIRASGIRCVQTLHDLKLACPNYKMYTQGSVCERCKGGNYWNAVSHRCLTHFMFGNALAAFEMDFAKSRQAYEKTVSMFIAPSEFYHRKMIEWGEPANRFVTIPNPVDLADVPAKGGGGFVLYVGRLSQEKGVDIFIRAAAQVPNLIVKIVGRGPEEARLKELAQSLGADNVTFLGFVPPDKVNALRDRAEAVIVPSLWYENSPLALLEAMGQGVPIIASHIGGMGELVKDGENGWLVEPGNVESFAEALRRLLGRTCEQHRAMGDIGREMIRARHGWKEHIEKLEKVYRP